MIEIPLGAAKRILWYMNLDDYDEETQAARSTLELAVELVEPSPPLVVCQHLNRYAANPGICSTCGSVDLGGGIMS